MRILIYGTAREREAKKKNDKNYPLLSWNDGLLLVNHFAEWDRSAETIFGNFSENVVRV
jgi:hypothetical protein